MPPKSKSQGSSKSASKSKSKSAAPVTGQKSLDTFFGGRKKRDVSEGEGEDGDEYEYEETKDATHGVEEDLNEEEDGSGLATVDASLDSLPPIVAIPEIFADIVKRVPKLKGVAEHVKGRKIRIATMCSGTESPLLALDLIQKSIFNQHGVQLELEHVFSCEIEPFKQAYIERNFRPPLLFRDVCELGQSHAYVFDYSARCMR
jgi:hypothetical protein